ncbi:MAG TPA: hypothetical protein VGF95_10185 [Solirubrobacteraceae bacterium]|jgi:hypothetical protein
MTMTPAPRRDRRRRGSPAWAKAAATCAAVLAIAPLTAGCGGGGSATRHTAQRGLTARSSATQTQATKAPRSSESQATPPPAAGTGASGTGASGTDSSETGSSGPATSGAAGPSTSSPQQKRSQAPGGTTSSSLQARLERSCEVAGRGLRMPTGPARPPSGQLPSGQPSPEQPPPEEAETSAERAARYIAIQRRIEALTQLRSPAAERGAIGHLRVALRRLLEVEELGQRGGRAVPGALVQATEEEAGRYAEQAGIPACGPPSASVAPPGRSEPVAPSR